MKAKWEKTSPNSFSSLSCDQPYLACSAKTTERHVVLSPSPAPCLYPCLSAS